MRECGKSLCQTVQCPGYFLAWVEPGEIWVARKSVTAGRGSQVALTLIPPWVCMETVWVALDLGNQSSKSADARDGIKGVAL